LAINQVLASEAFSTTGTRQIRKDQTKRSAQLVKDMKAGSVHTLIMSGVNPVYTLAVQLLLLKGLKVTTSVSLAKDETASKLIAAPVPHYLEAGI
jgi:molybdopterin-containing oxidoreductase family iron-sulfur binding subunit